DAHAAALHLYGYTREDMLGLSLTDITTTDRTLIYKRHNTILEDGSAHFESVHKRKDGSVVDVEVYSGAIEGELSRTTFSIVHDISERKRAEKQVVEQRNHLTALMNALADCAMLLDTGGRIITLNTAAAKVLNASEEELVGESLFERVAPKDETTLRRIIEMVMESGIPRREEYGSGDAVWDITCYPVLDIRGEVGGIALYGKDVSARKRAEERVRWLSARVLSAQEDERKRIGRELHDSTAQTLSGIKFMMEADLAEMERAAVPHDTRVVRKVVSLLQGAIIELRRIIMDLRPTVLDDLGLLSALRWLQDEFSTMHGHIGIRLLMDMDEELLDERQKSVLFRIAQEALANAVRHSGADAISFSLLREGSNCCLTIADNGIGFDPQEMPGAGIGLDSMRERLELVEGQLHILSEKGIGTQVRALVPLATSETSTATSTGS
ncbi:MAG: PAS domain S-box protein, partial [Halodesulfovibrio sp.]